MRVYLDHNATSPLRPVAREAMLQALALGGNASSVHAEGRAARRLIDDSREKLAFAIGALPQSIVFTSGGTEANNMALGGAQVERLLVSAVEHPSVLAAAQASGKPVEVIPVDGMGCVDLAALQRLLAGPRALVSVMLVNNETGVIQPVAEVAALAARAGSLSHVDAVQAFGKLKLNAGLLGCDLLTLGAHKAGGPPGVGALVIRDGVAIRPLLAGGGQELRRRAGTENLAAIAGFAAVAGEELIDTGHLADLLADALQDAAVLGAGAPRLRNTVCFGVPGMRAEITLMAFDLEGIAVSAGAACSSGKVAKSHVLDAMGVAPELAAAALRVSLGWNSTPADIDRFTAVWRRLFARHRARAAA